jgi:CrcB protein
MLLVYLAAGGVIGTLARHGLGTWVPTWAGTALPWGTFLVNALGSFVLGFAVRASTQLDLSAELRGFVMVGFCGAFTTFSTFSYETVALMQEGHWARAAAYALGSVAVGLAAVVAGMGAANLAFRTGG